MIAERARRRRPLGVPEPERGRLPAAGLRGRPGPHRDHRARIDHRPRSRPAVWTSGCSATSRSAVAFVGLGWAKKGLDAVNQLAEAWPAPDRGAPLRPAERGRVAGTCTRTAPTTTRCCPSCCTAPGSRSCSCPAPTPRRSGIVMSEAIVAGMPVIGASLRRARRAHPGRRLRVDDRPEDREGIRALIERLDRARRRDRARDARGAARPALDGGGHRAPLRGAVQELARVGLGLRLRRGRAAFCTSLALPFTAPSFSIAARARATRDSSARRATRRR